MAASTTKSVPATAGLGARCAEAQADGVPCAEIADCEVCGLAVRCPHEVEAPAASGLGPRRELH